MGKEEKIDIDLFKVVTRAIAHSDSLDIMTEHLTQLLVGALGIKGSSIFVLNPESSELEILASFGLSADYLNKGPLLSVKSLKSARRGEPIIIENIEKTDRLQYPENAREEGIAAIISIPILGYGKVVGALRLYHSEPWEISERDVDSLVLLGEHIGLAMMYTRLLNTVLAVKESVEEVHSVWLEGR